jgi:hypothetical protein
MGFAEDVLGEGGVEVFGVAEGSAEEADGFGAAPEGDAGGGGGEGGGSGEKAAAGACRHLTS